MNKSLSSIQGKALFAMKKRPLQMEKGVSLMPQVIKFNLKQFVRCLLLGTHNSSRTMSEKSCKAFQIEQIMRKCRTGEGLHKQISTPDE